MTISTSLAVSAKVATLFRKEDSAIMAKFKGAILSCVQCGGDFKVPPSRADTATTCSHACAVVQRGKSLERKVELTCKGCGGKFSVPRCHGDRRAYCSYECREAHPATVARKAAGTAQANSQWSGGRTLRADGYVYVLTDNHPLSSKNYVLEHRLVMENWLLANDPGSQYLVEIESRKVLSPAYEVHHKDEVKDHNSIANLQCMTPSEHRAHHNEFIRKALAFYRAHLKGISQ